MELLLCGAFSVTGIWHFPPLGFCFCPHRPDDLGGLLLRLNPAPFIRRISPAQMAVREPEFVRLPKFRVASAPVLGDLDEAQRFQLAQCRCDGMTMDSVTSEDIICNWQSSVFVAAVVRH